MAEPTGPGLPASARTGRPGPIDLEPGARLGATLSLLEEIDRAARSLQPLLRTVNRMTGLAPAEAIALMALAHGSRVPMGTTRDPSALTALAQMGLATSAQSPPGGGPQESIWRLTDTGCATLEQVQGLRIRAIGTLVDTLDDCQVDAIHAAVRGIVDALEDLPIAADDGPPRTLP